MKQSRYSQSRYVGGTQIVALSLAGAALSTGAWAEEPVAAVAPQVDESTIADIVVTARRRQEASQTVPVAISAFTQEGLNQRRIQSAQDLRGQVPSLQIGNVGQSRSTESFTLRGQGTTFLSAPGVVTYFAESALVPGTYVSTQGPPGMLLDLANLQVLRGPQGTLFGRNTTGGAVLLEPARPTNRHEGYLQAQFGNYRDREVEAVVNLPLVDDRLMVRLAGRYVNREGFTRDILTGNDLDDRHYYTGRIGVTFRPADGIENYLVAYGTKSETNGTGFVLEQVNVPVLGSRFAARGGCAGVGLGANCSVLTDIVAAQAQRGIRQVAGLEGRANISGWGVHDQLSIDLSDTLTLRNIASYGELKTDLRLDQDGTPFNIYNVRSNDPDPIDSTWQWTEELQLQGRARDDKLTFALGIYADRSESNGLQGQNNLTFLNDTRVFRGFKRWSYAGYVQATYDVGDVAAALNGLNVTGGIRRTWDRATGFGAAYRFNANGSVSCTNGANAAPAAPLDCRFDGRSSSSATTWTLGLDYRVARNFMVYAKAGRGYKTGGVNYSAVNPSNLGYQPEYVKTYEMGFKSDVRLGSVPTRLNATLFSTRYKNIQRASGDFNVSTLASGAIVINAASATIRGLEMEGQIEPVRGVQLSGNYTYLDAKYGQYIFPALGPLADCTGARRAGPIDLSCLPFQFTPKHQFSINAVIDLPLPDAAGKMNLAATYSHIGRQYSSPGTLPIDEPGAFFEGYDLANASLNWKGMFSSPVDLTLFVTNLFDKTYRTSNTNVFQTLAVQSSIYGEPRMYGVQLRYRWGS